MAWIVILDWKVQALAKEITTLKSLNLANCFQVGARVLGPVAKANTSLTELRLLAAKTWMRKPKISCKTLSWIEEY